MMTLDHNYESLETDDNIIEITIRGMNNRGFGSHELE